MDIQQEIIINKTDKDIHPIITETATRLQAIEVLLEIEDYCRKHMIEVTNSTLHQVNDELHITTINIIGSEQFKKVHHYIMTQEELVN